VSPSIIFRILKQSKKGTLVRGVPLERVEWPLDRTRDHFVAIIYLAGGLESLDKTRDPEQIEGQEKGYIDLLTLSFSRRNGSPGKTLRQAQGMLKIRLSTSPSMDSGLA